MNQLIRCTDCNEIFLKSPFDRRTEYERQYGSPSESFRGVERDDFQDFLKNHRGHRFEDLEIIDQSFVSEKAYAEPVKVSYFKATNGKERFVIKKYRKSIDEPLRYQLIAGDYTLEPTGFEIQTKEIARQLNAEFKVNPLTEAQIAAFLKLYRQVVEIIDPEDLERIPEESSNPLEVYYRLDGVGLAYLLRNCRNIFKDQEYLDVEAFVHRHKEDGVLLLKRTYRIQLSWKAKPEKKAAYAAIPLQEKKMAKKE